ncbi:MAG: hypothetical protein KA369_09065 [Spirochaetes bacterium]|nr:hypothetical protein [Spirochaetota bacterium]
MEPNMKYLNELTRQLDDLKTTMVEGGLESMNAGEIERLLANIRDFYGVMEKGFDAIADLLESRDSVSH